MSRSFADESKHLLSGAKTLLDTVTELLPQAEAALRTTDPLPAGCSSKESHVLFLLRGVGEKLRNRNRNRPGIISRFGVARQHGAGHFQQGSPEVIPGLFLSEFQATFGRLKEAAEREETS